MLNCAPTCGDRLKRVRWEQAVQLRVLPLMGNELSTGMIYYPGGLQSLPPSIEPFRGMTEFRSARLTAPCIYARHALYDHMNAR